MAVETARFRRTLPRNGWGRTRVVVVGCGGIGSYTAAALVRMGAPEVGLCDFDKVEGVNVATQDLAHEDVGELKVYAVADKLRRINPDVDVRTWKSRFREEVMDWQPHIVVTAVDSIEAREEIVGLCEGRVELVVDPRMGFEALEVYCHPKGRDDGYLETLAERDHQQAPCGAQAIAYTGMMAGSVVGSIVRRWLMGATMPTLVSGDIGSYEMQTCWMEGEGWEMVGLN